MGLFANGYNKALAADAFGLRPNTFSNRAASAMLAAASYQLLSFDANAGLTIKPLKFNKQWYGYWQGYFTSEGMDIFLSLLKKYNGMKFLFGSTLAAASGVMIIEGEARQTWRYAQDGPLTLKQLLTNRNSYWIHFVGSGGLYWAISRHTKSKELALAYTTFLIWMWEVKDGYIWWEDVGFLGGDGFSWADGWAGTIAAMGSYAVSKFILPDLKRSKNHSLDKSRSVENKKRKLFFTLLPEKEKFVAKLRFVF
ncbi:MAG: hypothetical protein ACE5I1_31575 [bacterium]